MTGLFSMIMVLLIAFAAVFVGYYAWRLLQLRRAGDDSSRRMSAMMHELRSVSPADGRGIGSPEASASVSASAPMPSRSYERKVAVRALSPNPVYLRRDKAGEIIVQLEDRPPMPLKYVLDPRARQILQEVAMVAGVEYGERWSVLASEDEAGRLVLTRLV